MFSSFQDPCANSCSFHSKRKDVLGDKFSHFQDVPSANENSWMNCFWSVLHCVFLQSGSCSFCVSVRVGLTFLSASYSIGQHLKCVLTKSVTKRSAFLLSCQCSPFCFVQCGKRRKCSPMRHHRNPLTSHQNSSRHF